MTDATSAIATEIIGSLAIVRFTRPSERNALSIATLAKLRSSVSSLVQRSVEAIIFTGTDDVFTSGANIRELRRLDPLSAKQFASAGQHLFQTIADARPLTIAAINGYCLGGGLDLALACNIRVASTDALFAHPGARLGIITGWGGTQRLSRLIGRARALELFATAKYLTAAEALKIGLVNGLGDPVLEHALHIAANIR